MRVLTIVLAVLLPVTTMAQETQPLQFVPAWHMANGQACYTFEEAKKLLEIDSKLKLCQIEEEETPKVIAKLRLANIQLGEASQKKDVALAERDAQVKQLTDDLKACTKEKNDCKAKWTPGVGWAIAGGVSFVLIGVLIGFFAIPRQ